MSDLVYLMHDVPYTSSEIIAEQAGITHASVQRLILKHQKVLGKRGALRFKIREVIKNGGKNYEKIYSLNEKQALLLLALLRNTEPVVELKAQLVDQFVLMRRLLMERQTPVWQSTRQLAKEARRIETDTTKQLVAYATANGSTHAASYYKTITTLANKAAGIMNRNYATIIQLNMLIVVEQLIARTIAEAIAEGVEYHQVFERCKSRVSAFSTLAQIPQIISGTEAI